MPKERGTPSRACHLQASPPPAPLFHGDVRTPLLYQLRLVLSSSLGGHLCYLCPNAKSGGAATRAPAPSSCCPTPAGTAMASTVALLSQSIVLPAGGGGGSATVVEHPPAAQHQQQQPAQQQQQQQASTSGAVAGGCSMFGDTDTLLVRVGKRSSSRLPMLPPAPSLPAEHLVLRLVPKKKKKGKVRTWHQTGA